MVKLTIDGTEFSLPCSVTRQADIKGSDISGELLNGDYFNDVLGTYMRYSVNLAVPIGKEAEYTTLYEILTDPVSSHKFILQYNQGTITLTARVETVKDKYVGEVGSAKIWRSTTFDIISNKPSKEPTA